MRCWRRDVDFTTAYEFAYEDETDAEQLAERMAAEGTLVIAAKSES
ncbi:MAG: hypothetical protein KF847_18310 [Pirellulales bacterium]|nr:hypothetical protein [Pirellulales bacterium]